MMPGGRQAWPFRKVVQKKFTVYTPGATLSERRKIMWQPKYEPMGGNLAVSAAVGVIPILVLFVMLGVFRRPGWMAALAALGSALVIARAAYGMPLNLAIMSTLNG